MTPIAILPDILIAMAPLQVIVLLLIIRLPAILGESGVAVGPARMTGGTSAFVVASYLFTLGALLFFVWQRTRRAVGLLNLPSTNGADVSHNVDRLLSWSRWATSGIVAVHLFMLNLPTVVHGWLARTVLLGKVPLIAEAIYYLPVFLVWLGFWTANYQVESANRERSFAYRLAQGLPAHPMPPLGQYLSMQIRHNFYLLVPICLVMLVKGVAAPLEATSPNAAGAITCILTISVMCMVPWLLTRIWTTVPLRGPLRHRMDAIASEYRVRFRNVLIWKTHNQVTNAAILGPVRFVRYFLMTDALLEQLTDQQIESVFAHEIGHGVHRHILWYLAGMAGAVFLIDGVVEIFLFYSPMEFKNMMVSHLGNLDATSAVLTTVMMTLLVGFGFPFVSHRFEHQADWFAARHMGKVFRAKPKSVPIPALALTEAPDPAEFSASIVDLQTLPVQAMSVEQYVAGEYAHARAGGAGPRVGPNIENAPPIQAVLPPEIAGTEVFISSLDTLIEITHRSRDKRGWMHPSINRRVKLLRQLTTDPAAADAFRRRMIATRVIIAAVIVLGAAAGYISWRVEQRAAGINVQPTEQTTPHSTGKSMWI